MANDAHNLLQCDSGDRVDLYNGMISFTFSHVDRPKPSNSQKIARIEDLQLEAECGYSLQIFDLIDAGRAIPKIYKVLLNEGGGWIDSRTRKAPNRLDFLSVLAHLRTIKIRGSFYKGAETVRLQSFRIEEPRPGSLKGSQLFPCCSTTRQ